MKTNYYAKVGVSNVVH